MQELIKYFEALEARLAAQEERIAALETAVEQNKQYFEKLDANTTVIKEHMSRMQEILNEAMQATPDSDLEVELVYPEDDEVTEELQQEESVAEPEPSVEPASAPEPVAEPESVAEPEPMVAEPQPEPAQPAQPEAPRMPQQTSLFGTPVTDIRQAVSIGDRFLFQRELFAGSAEELQKTLSELDSMHSLNEATAFIEKFGWDKQSPTYELFMNVLRRRFQ